MTDGRAVSSEMAASVARSNRLVTLYERGATPITACPSDARFAYGLYVPHRFDQADRSETILIVSVHGTSRMQALYRDLFAEFAEYNNCVVLAPLFPVGVLGDGNMSGYKFLREGDIRYDLVMISMIDTVREQLGIPERQVLMFGFSGGAHFTHRFTILHPDRVLGASIASPGAVTCLDPDRPWWPGTGDVAAEFGVEIDYGAFRGKALHFAVGEADTETWEITFGPGDKYFTPGANDAGATRGERIETLAASFERYGAHTRLDRLPGVTHDVTHLARAAKHFFADVIDGRSSTTARVAD